MNTAQRLKSQYLDFFQKRGHRLLPNVSLIPENDPTTLFISAGMHPLVPYLLGEIHPLGKRLVSVQKCLRTDDIENVGDGFHHTFFEMLGNWSLGEYWKEEAVAWSWEFLTKILKYDPEKINLSCFAGDKDAPKDEETADIWRSLGVPEERVFFLGKKDNWWGPVGKTGPCGPDSEMFIDTDQPKCGPNCDVSCQCGKYVEVWNDVFMQYNKIGGGYKSLSLKNVDTGMGVERATALIGGFGNDDYRTELFWPIIQKIEQTSGRKYEGDNIRPMRIIADHARAAVFLIADGILPGNVEQGYVLRRLIRRAVRQGKVLGVSGDFISEMTKTVVDIYGEDDPDLLPKKQSVLETLKMEEEKFGKTLARGLQEIERYQKLDGKIAFYLYESYGFPLEVTEEIAEERRQKIDKKTFEEEFFRHQRTSRAGAGKKFSGGLANHSGKTIKLHTATHLLHQALRDILGSRVNQAGSNITDERLRFDFTYPQRLTEKEVERTEKLVNKQIMANLPVKMEITSLDEAKKRGATALFIEKYGERVKLYSIGDYSCEVCGGPHAEKTKDLGKFSIIKEEAAGAGKRRIYAKLL